MIRYSALWIGVYGRDDNDQYIWLNGNLLPDDHENWISGKQFLFLSQILPLYYPSLGSQGH